ncbi:phosphoglycerate mutase [Magnaporthiopsis poae ATCC 64411]|uniref:Phosphoglycerate mutase n=1 Tax=Magnaporthiopsis poae (strain ATCC 64411 / 73-15) TaxID=644358 RepID=A0A0C4E122_MAGP6|nr:phosphoglycerate mutase [Magnaporthiopsis poae ATCC 64411]
MAPPTYIFVVRHGNRLDVADKHWHLSSPTPYDPPLTYSGWAQSRAVGTQISNILRDRSVQDANPSQPSQSPGKPKRYRIVIHSSPFARCLQTSIAISAGLMGRPSLLAPAQRNLSPTQVSQLAGAETVETNGSTKRAKQRRTSIVGKKTVLRIDAFLGEWLSPSYFELITPPPGSVMMLASAKASLLKAEDYKSYPHLQARSHSNASASVQPPKSQLWAAASPRPSLLSGLPASAVEDAAPSPPLQNMTGMKDSLPAATGAAAAVEVGAYDPPVPAFSMPKNATIPAGYVNHAKDACVVVDYQWDSMRPPYNWGDGGELPEDWPDMHKRFKKGLQALVDWYTNADDPASAVTTEYVKPGPDGLIPAQPENEEDENVETVVILVSHGAGCNAMIGAITHRPALMDVPISSLSMAALKKTGQVPNGVVGPGATDGSVPLHQMYDLVLNTSTDHLRSAAPTPNASHSPSMASVYGGHGAGAARGRSASSFSTPSGGSSPVTHMEGLNRSSSISGSVASIRRGLRDQAASSRTPSGLSVGLWTPAPKSDFEYGLDDEEAIVFDQKQPSPPPSSTKSPPRPARQGHQHGDELDDQLTHLPKRSTRTGGTGKGLWISDGGVSTPPSVPAAGPMRDQNSSKRRWTVTAERP